MSSRNLSGVRETEAVIMPCAPALATAAANFQLPSPAIAPCRMGYLQPSNSVTLVFHSIPLPPQNSMAQYLY
jgi:hypothetical protein